MKPISDTIAVGEEQAADELPLFAPKSKPSLLRSKASRSRPR